jgi:hypothetical protein
MDNVDRFFAQMKELKGFPFGHLTLKSRTITMPISQIESPVGSASSSSFGPGTPAPTGNSILFTRKTLGEGSFGRVTHVWDVSTGAEYASKLFFNANKVDWKGEADRMKKLSHVSGHVPIRETSRTDLNSQILYG